MATRATAAHWGASHALRRGRAAPLAPLSSSFLTGATWQTSARCFSQGPGYGTIPSDIEGSRHAPSKPKEEDILRQQQQQQQQQASGEPQQAGGYNPWQVLGLQPGASTQTIRTRYHELMREVHPDLATDGTGDIPRLNQINKAYELITKSPTLDRQYRKLVSDKQYVYYKLLPEWMARNVDEMPRYYSWMRWRTPSGFQIFLLAVGCYALGRFYVAMPKLTTVFISSVVIDILFHTMIAPASLSMLFLYSIMSYHSYDMAWLTSPKGFLRRELGY
ncbi:chaperone protein DNAJ [Strigomonas culicis]|nr:chaperone protein DNAJ [Strigomonas culicis]|eukprot:EPY20758.1 chaperone protein DNAJ [Strigomonas culicis]